MKVYLVSFGWYSYSDQCEYTRADSLWSTPEKAKARVADLETEFKNASDCEHAWFDELEVDPVDPLKCDVLASLR